MHGKQRILNLKPLFQISSKILIFWLSNHIPHTIFSAHPICMYIQCGSPTVLGHMARRLLLQLPFDLSARASARIHTHAQSSRALGLLARALTSLGLQLLQLPVTIPAICPLIVTCRSRERGRENRALIFVYSLWRNDCADSDIYDAREPRRRLFSRSVASLYCRCGYD